MVEESRAETLPRGALEEDEGKIDSREIKEKEVKFFFITTHFIYDKVMQIFQKDVKIKKKE